MSVGGDMVSGAVNVVSTNSAKSEREPALFHLGCGVTQQQFAQAVATVKAHHGDLNYLDPYGQLVFNALAAPGTSSAETVLPAGNYYALDTMGRGTPPSQSFSVSQSASPAALPDADATITTIDFGFAGPVTLHDGEMVRAENDGFLVHMDAFGRVRSLAAARRVLRLLRAGKTGRAFKLFVRAQGAFAGPLSSGSLQQAVLNATPGVYVQFCVMRTQDGRSHIRLGMERIFRIAKAAHSKPPHHSKK